LQTLRSESDVRVPGAVFGQEVETP
jgi:hypothetical protein